MKKNILIYGFFFLLTSVLGAHEGHHSHEAQPSEPFIQAVQMTSFDKLVLWIGNFHPIVLHFPIALILMTGIAEWLYYRSSSPIYDHAAQFMIISAAIMVIPTALFGIALGYGTNYQGEMEEVFWWHASFGLATMALAIIIPFLRQRFKKTYLYLLALLILFVNITGFLGGTMSFGFQGLIPPIFVFS